MRWRDDAQMWWPDCELDRVYSWMYNRIDSVGKVMAHVGKTHRYCCIQAGGYIGMWPSALAAYFKHVHTFEPIPELYDVLVKNTQMLKHVAAYPLALGERCGMAQIAFRPGGRSVLDVERFKDNDLESISMTTIDALGLERVGLIYLDTERSELEILRGAVATIERDRPVVVLEILDGQDEEYDSHMLRTHGYRRVAITHRDAIYTRH